jgi:tetratricopeptide (TPR) repeat protein
MSQTADDVRANIVRIVDKKGAFSGTAFFIKIKGGDKYCVTCHHCINRLDEIYVERKGDGREKKMWVAEWVEKFSQMSKDIAILNVPECKDIKPLLHAKQAQPQMPVSVWGYSQKNLDRFPHGSPASKGLLSDAPFLFNFPEEVKRGTQEWNKKPEVSLNVYQFDGNFEGGFSGAPVCYVGNNNVVGVFTAKEPNYGYVIPIEDVLEKFEPEEMWLMPPLQSDKDVTRWKYSTFANHGVLLMTQRRFGEALSSLNDCITTDPNRSKNDDMLMNNIGMCLSNLNRPQEAIECLDRAIEIQPNSHITWVNKGNVLTKIGRLPEAIQCFDRALEINPNYPDAWTRKGNAFNQLLRPHEANACWLRARQLGSTL